jgi:hypothetical protein
MKAFNIAEFIGMYEVKGGSADELMRFVTCLYLSEFREGRMVRLTKKFTDRLCHKNPAGLQVRRESMVESGVGGGGLRYTCSEKSTIPTR